tara:strand:+ start:782 stop:1384 length:603 start_codon:yes stop_codon:yes gene_type:complete
MRKDIDIKKIISAMNLLGHNVFENDSKPYNVNIVAIRSDTPTPNKFNDLLCIFWKYEGIWNMVQQQCTTLAGIPWMTEPCNSKGCAILKEGQYLSAWKIGMHRGSYKALVQVNPVDVYRDNDKDLEYDMLESSVDTGVFGINLHRASSKTETLDVNKFSAGCIVTQNPHEYDVFMKICDEAVEVWGNSFTVALIKESNIQ